MKQKLIDAIREAMKENDLSMNDLYGSAVYAWVAGCFPSVQIYVAFEAVAEVRQLDIEERRKLLTQYENVHKEDK